jgi:tripartite-type tricarboxylate transporter receptor subunit TctC
MQGVASLGQVMDMEEIDLMFKHCSRNILRTGTLLLLGAMSSTAYCQSYPVKPIRFIVPFPTPGAVDIVGRSMAVRLSQALGQPIVVENRAGAGGVIGSEIVAKAVPDGYTLLTSSSSTHSIAPAMDPKLPYDTAKDFTPIVNFGEGRSVLVVAASSPWKNLMDLVNYVKARPGQANYASAGIGTIAHLNNESFVQQAGLQVVHVPYKGTQLAVPDILSGQITFMVDSITSAVPQVLGGKLRALAINGARRSATLPDVPTYVEAGLSSFQSGSTYQGLWGPAGLPAPIVQRLNSESNRILQSSDAREVMAKLGVEPVGGTPEEFGATVQKDIARWREIIVRGNIKPQ